MDMITDHGTLRWLKSPIINDDHCQAWLEPEFPHQNVTINEDMVCAGVTPNPDIKPVEKHINFLERCIRDAGGPLVCKSGDRALLIGIASLIQPKCRPFAGFAKISNFVDWIRTKMVR